MNCLYFLTVVEFSPRVASNDKIWFVTVNFNGTGNHALTINGTESIGPVNIDVPVPDNQTEQLDEENNGCLIATAAFGTELSPKVQKLREVRDDVLLQTESGSSFMSAFNQFYYTFSPTIADMERQNTLLKEAIKITITPMIDSLTLLDHVQIDSEPEMISYGIALILLNIGMYSMPVIGLIYAKKYVGLFD